MVLNVMILSMKKHKVTYFELINNKKFNNYKEEYAYLKKLLDDGKISAIRSSGTNGKRPAMFNVFWLYEEEPDYSAYIHELNYSLDSRINPEFYLKHPDVYDYERKYVISLSNYLKSRENELSVRLSENERSYSIWHLEKFLSGQGCSSTGKAVSASAVLKHCGIDISLLNVYHTTEPFSYFSFSRDCPQNILILENLDPFYGMRACLMNGKTQILGKDFFTLIYGAGKKVSSIFSGFKDFAEDYMKDTRNKFYYFGDLDYEGLGIFESLHERTKSFLDLRPFVPAYKALISDFSLEILPDSKELQNKNSGSLFLSFFDEEDKSSINEILKSGKYIPQEKLSVLDY